jgi:uncharacterized membrane protein YjgN (DUF898 family)
MSSYSLFQKIGVILVVILVAIAILGGMWASWGMKYGKTGKRKGVSNGNCGLHLSQLTIYIIISFKIVLYCLK